MSAAPYSDSVLNFINRHGINEEIAELIGFAGDGDAVTFKYSDADGDYLRRRRLPAGKTIQPKGRKLSPWTPIPTDGALLVLEGESDLLAAASAMYTVVNVADDDDPEWEVDRRRDLPPPIRNLVPVALPGVGNCHGQIVGLAADLVADVVLLFDGDDAGRSNAEKLARKIDATEHISATVVPMPDGRDLSDLLADGGDGAEILANLVAEAEAVQESTAEPVAEVMPPNLVGELLDEALVFMDRYVSLPGEAERSALALFIAHSYAIAGAHATPYMLILSPEKRSGKTRLMETLALLVARPWPVIGASVAAVFRKIGKDQPTMMHDEIDAVFGSNAERTEPLRAILNAGNRPGSTVSRCVGEAKDVEDFPIFCPKVLAGIDNGRIPDTIRDRSVPIGMRRKTASEPVERFRHRIAAAEIAPLRTRFEGWAAGEAVDLP
jgi:hypothetical protein